MFFRPTNRIFWKLLAVFFVLAVGPIAWEAAREARHIFRLAEGVGAQGRSILLADFERSLRATAADLSVRLSRRAAGIETGLRRLAGEADAVFAAPPPAAAPVAWNQSPSGVLWVRRPRSVAVLFRDLADRPGGREDDRRYAALEETFADFVAGHELVSSAYLWTSQGALFITPGFDPTESIRTGGIPINSNFDRQRSFPPRIAPGSPAPELKWSGAYEDQYYGGGWVISCLAPLYGKDGAIRAEVGVDWRIQPQIDEVIGTAGIAAALVDGQGHLLGATPDMLEAFGLPRGAASPPPSSDLASWLPPAGRTVFAELRGGSPSVLSPGAAPAFMFAVQPIEGRDWRVIVAGRLADRFQAVRALEALVTKESEELKARLLQRLGILGIIVIAGAWLASRNFSGPLERLTRAAREVGAGKVARDLPLERGDEFGILARAFQEAAGGQQRKIALLTALHELSSATRLVTDRDRTAGELAGIVRSALGVDRCSIALWDRDGSRLRPVASARKEGARERAPRPDESGELRRVFETGEPLVRGEERTGGGASVLAVSLEAEGDRIGVLIAERDGAGFSPEELESLRAFADAAGLVLRVARLVRALEESGRELVDANRQKNYFMQNLNHEIRTPLTAVSGWAEVLEDFETMSPAQRQDAVKQLGRAAGNLLTLVEDLLDMSRLESGSLAIQSEAVRVEPLLAELVSTMEPVAAGKKVRLVHSGCDAGEGDGTAWADPLRLRQILWNLLDNAVKFTPEGGEVRLGASQKDGLWRFTVDDTGTGIPPEELPRIFDRFRQGDGRISRRHRGIGVGLALARSLASLMGGAIRVESEAGAGSRFTVEIPAQEGSALPDAGVVLVCGSPTLLEEVQAAAAPLGWQARGATGWELLGAALDILPAAVVFDLTRGGEEEVAATARTLRVQPRLRNLRLVGIIPPDVAGEPFREILDTLLPPGCEAERLRAAIGSGFRASA